MRIVFMGTPDFSVPCLKALSDAGHEIIAVYSQPPRKSGRGHKVNPTPVHQFADENGWEVRTPLSLKSVEEETAFAELDADLAVVVAYGLILPQAVLQAPELGCINVHASLLPRWRGAAPIQRAIETGDAQSGVCIMQMDKGLDTGAVISRTEINLSAETTGQSLHDDLSAMGSDLLIETVSKGDWSSEPQPAEGVTYAHKLEKSEGELDFTQSAEILERKIRAFFPWPGTTTLLGDKRLKVLRASLVTQSGEPETLLDEQLTVACGDNQALRLERVQLQGKGAMDAADFLRGNPVPAGTRLG